MKDGKITTKMILRVLNSTLERRHIDCLINNLITYCATIQEMIHYE